MKPKENKISEDLDILGATCFKYTPKIKEMIKKLISLRERTEKIKKDLIKEVEKQPHDENSLALDMIECSIEVLSWPKWKKELFKVGKL